MVLSVYMPHGFFAARRTTLELVKMIMEEGKALGTKDFLIGWDLKIKLDGAGLEFHGLNSLDWYGPSGPECRVGAHAWTSMTKDTSMPPTNCCGTLIALLQVLG